MSPTREEGRRARGARGQVGSFVSRELEGELVLRVLCYAPTPELVDMLLLQCSDGLWQRFFLSMGETFWSEVVGEEDAFAGYEDIVDEFVDVTDKLASRSLNVDTVEAREGAEWSVVITFDSGASLRLQATEPESLESDSRLVVHPAV